MNMIKDLILFSGKNVANKEWKKGWVYAIYTA
jgi:hypothetical protein